MWIAKGTLLARWLFGFGSLGYLYFAILRHLPPNSAVGVSVFSARTIHKSVLVDGSRSLSRFRLCDCPFMALAARFVDRIAGDRVDTRRMSRIVPRSHVQTEAGKSGEFMKMRFALFTASLLAGCARIQDVGSLATVHAVLQKDAPVQIVSITPSGDNELATVTIKNTTDRYVQDMSITWAAFRPVNCAASGTAPRIYLATRIASSADAKDWRGGARVLKPHKQTDITSLSLSRTELQELAKKYNAKKLRVQVGMAYVNFTTGNNFTSRNGPPDWRDENVERTNILDAEDAASAACAEQK